MKTVTSIKQFRQIRKTLGTSKLGFVPTMGALHQGHISLLERSVGECDVTVLSIFLNPTQFNNPDDLKNLPHHSAGRPRESSAGRRRCCAAA
jgi:pantoate--beta-alanine ligase